MTEFELKRQKRRTLAVTVKEGKVIVSAPLKMPLSSIERFLLEKTDWINAKIAEYARKKEYVAFAAEYKSILVEGAEFPLVRSDEIKRITFGENCVLVPVKYDGDKDKMLRVLASFYKKFSYKKLKERLDFLSEETRLPYNGFSLTNAKGKWGSCDGDNNIMLNWRLYMLSPHLTDYVIIHELCHTAEHNHSPRFWAAVEKMCPEYKKLRKILKERSVVNELFR